MTIDAFVYLAVVPSLLICAVELVRLYQLRKHDVVLYRFCEIRRDMMTLLRDRGTELSPQDYHALRIFLKALNTLIQRYSDDRSSMLNLRTLARWAKKNAKLIKSTTDIPKSSDREIQALQARMTVAIALGFFAYTRFLRSEILLSVLHHIARLIAQIGTQAVKNAANNVSQTLNQIEFIQAHKSSSQGPECHV